MKLKYDGECAYGWYSQGEFWINNASVATIDSTLRDLYGLFIYQVETERLNSHAMISDKTKSISAKLRDNDDFRDCLNSNSITDDAAASSVLARSVITEVCFVLDHRAIVRTDGGGAVSRQLEVSEYPGGNEQIDTERRMFYRTMELRPSGQI